MTKVYSVYEFLEKVEKEPLKWIGYCEVIITRSGSLFIAEPSHVTSITNYVCEKYGHTPDDLRKEIMAINSLSIEFLVDKYNLVAVWYSGYLSNEKINRFQKHTLSILQSKGLITNEPFIQTNANAYQEYLKLIDDDTMI